MSRAPPFPTRRRTPSITNGNLYQTQPLSAPGISSSTRPLQLSRPISRPTTPVNSFASGSPLYTPSLNTAPLGFSRPQRSEMRTRPDLAISDSSSQDPYRDSNSARADIEGPSFLSLDENLQTTPISLTSAMSAFQSAGSRRRQTQESDDYYYKRERELEIEAEKARQQRIRDRAPGLRSRGSTRAGEIDAVLDKVKDGWEFVIDPNFNNVDLALQLLDNSSLGKDMDSFRRTKDMLSKALKGSVDKHYQVFAASLPHHSSLLGHLALAQTEMSSARSAILEAKEYLGSKRADLVQLWNRGQTLDEMINLLDQIEHLKAVPDLLETLMSEKRLLQASILLVRSLKIINKQDMLEIGAVSDLRSYLNGQEIALREILAEELQNHLYLKSFWCESRWAAYVPNQSNFPKVEFEAEADTQFTEDDQASPTSPLPVQSRLSRYLNNLGLRPNDPPHDVNENLHPGTSSTSSSNSGSMSLTYVSANQNPEADSFTYMETLLESLAVLGKLGNSLDTIAQRLPNEVFALVETTIGEVEERAEFGRRRSQISLNGGVRRLEGPYIFISENAIPGPQAIGNRGEFLKSSLLRLTALESFEKRVDHQILLDLFWTMYSKLVAVAQGFRVVTEVANRIGSRRDYKDSSGTKPGMLFPLQEIWSHVQSEVRTLIRDYLSDEDQGATAGRNPISSINEILRDGKFNKDKIKPVFRFSDTDMKLTTKALRQYEDGLNRVLKDTMPGLATNTSGDTAQTIVSNLPDDHLLGGDQHHRLLLRPDAFHVAVLFQPTLNYLHRVAEVFPVAIESNQMSSLVLDEFVLKVYLPQLEEKVSDLFHDAVSGPDAFQSDPMSLRLSAQPIARASTYLMALINSLCAMLNTSPFHRENYSRLILGVVIQFYQRCSDRYQTLTTTHASEIGLTPHIALSAQWAQRSELQPCFTELLELEEYDKVKLRNISCRESKIELQFLGQNRVANEDLISSTKNIAALASLYRSVAWFSSELNALKSRPEETVLENAMTPNNLEPLTGLTPSFPHFPVSSQATDTELIKLPLSKEMALRFQALLKTYEQLSTLILDTIRIDLRCRTIYFLDCAIRHGTYDSTYDAVEPDPHVVDLNTELVHCNEILVNSLPKKDRRYIFAGLGHLIEDLLIVNARQLRLPNAFGIKKIMRNILALQQGIRTITDGQEDSEFERVKQYYSLFFISPQEMLDGIRQKQTFTFEEYQTMLNLQCGIDPSMTGPGDTAAKGTDRNYSMYIIDLHGLEMDRAEVAN